MSWQVSGINRSAAQLVPRDERNREAYGGTPTDQSVIEAIKACVNNFVVKPFTPDVLSQRISETVSKAA